MPYPYVRTNRIVKTVDRLSKKHPFLMNLEGWYTAQPEVPWQYKAQYEQYLKSGSKMKATRWLLRNGLITEAETAILGEFLKNYAIDFKISCRHNDMERCKKSPHYISCLNGMHHDQKLINIADTGLAIVYVPDKAGHMLYRFFVRLVIVRGELGLFAYKGYGNSNRDGILKTLRALLPVVEGVSIHEWQWRSSGVKTKFYRAISKRALKQAWSDSPVEIRGTSLYIKGIL